MMKRRMWLQIQYCMRCIPMRSFRVSCTQLVCISIRGNRFFCSLFIESLSHCNVMQIAESGYWIFRFLKKKIHFGTCIYDTDFATNEKSWNWHLIHFLTSFEFSETIHPVGIHIYCIFVVQMTFYMKYVIKIKEPDCFRLLRFSHVHVCIIIMHMALMMYLTNCHHDDIQPHDTEFHFNHTFSTYVQWILPNLTVAENPYPSNAFATVQHTPHHTTLHSTSNVNTTCIVALSWMNIVQELILHFIQLLYSRHPTTGFIINTGSLHKKMV